MFCILVSYFETKYFKLYGFTDIVSLTLSDTHRIKSPNGYKRQSSIQELQKQKEDLYQQINDVRSAEGAQAAEATSRVYKAKLNVMAKEIEKNLTNIFDQMGVKRPENLTPKCP